MKRSAFALLLLGGLWPRLDACSEDTRTAQQSVAEVPFREVKTIRVTKPSLAEIPDFTMPKGSFWSGMKLGSGRLNLSRDFIRKGNTYFPIRDVVEAVADGKMSNAEALSFLKSLPAGTGFYEMLGDDDLHKRGGPLHGLWTNPVTVSPKDVAAYFTSVWNSRIGDFRLGTPKVLFDLDLEGFPPAWMNNQVLAEGVRQFRQQHPEVEFAMYASGRANLYPGGPGGVQNRYGNVGGDTRHEIYAKAGFTYFEMIPYAHFEEPLIGPGKPYADFADYARRSSLHIGKALSWLDARARFAGKGYKGMSWIMTRYEGGDWSMVAPHIIESLPLWFQVTGAGRSGGGLCNWHQGDIPLNVSDFAFEAGKWRVSRFNQFWEDPETEYDIRPEISLDGGKTWTPEGASPWPGRPDDWSPARFRWFCDDPKPIGVRAARLKNRLIVVAAHRAGLEAGESQTIWCRYEGKVWKLVIPYQTVVAGTVTL
jgi:hypothetical protein